MQPNIRSALFDVALQLSGTATPQPSTNMLLLSSTNSNSRSPRRTQSTVQDRSHQSCPTGQNFIPRCSLTPFLIQSKRNHTVVPRVRILRDIATQTESNETSDDLTSSIQRPSSLNLVSNDLCISETRDYTYTEPATSSSSSVSTKNSSVIKSTLLGLWNGLNNDDNNIIRSAATSPIDSKYYEDKARTNTPNWKAFTKVVTSLLHFTRKKERYEWIQLVGHAGAFKEGYHDGFILKELCEQERQCFELLQTDALRTYVPRYIGTVHDDEGKDYIQIQDLLATFRDPCIMDCKIGVRTYLEEDLAKSEKDPEPRHDLYNKMIQVDPLAPTAEENEIQKVVKPRYMMWRETLSSTAELGFRIEAIKKSRGLMSKEFQRTKLRDEVKKQIMEFIGNSLPRALIGSSLLFVHDNNEASIWMIDFGKTQPLKPGIKLTHDRSWIRGSHEDGYLIGIKNLIDLFTDIIEDMRTTTITKKRIE
ncbi:unnamed protein product [Didymodactylos carnosus]|uniref:Kinase n=1 Tax=Didymodactylos carnosus TaxID=1234261 RepID=A0A813SCL6_9BILA|nr:unnamed protein product [Didymodactylos carnosus]CAF0794646.1 unnamed protein product [Didymodactylos carnosus]CAF3539128.1 unnamed protein product [Didymodactylos carnosus]CAF3578981.1 unnamed protein product [Didymodactylos carnosus]